MATIEDLQKQIEEYANHGFAGDVAKGARQAQIATQDYIRRTHPSQAFDGRDLRKMIIKGAYKVENAGVIKANIYANYFARWYNTGANRKIIRGRGPRQGQHGPKYPPRGAYFETNAKAIEYFFADYLVNYLKQHVSL